jgi:hypothetical protein
MLIDVLLCITVAGAVWILFERIKELEGQIDLLIARQSFNFNPRAQRRLEIIANKGKDKAA